MLELLSSINKERGVTMVIVLHDLGQAAQLAHRLAVLNRGRLYEAARPCEVLRSDMLLDVFHVAADIQETAGAWTIHVRHPANPLRSF